MSMLKEFRDFAMKGNVIDMAVGIIIGAGFGKIVSSLVADVIMPPIGLMIGGVDFTRLQIVLKEAQSGAPAVALRYGAFLQQIFDFLIVAFAMFALIKAINALRRNEPVKPVVPAAPSEELVVLKEIRDALKTR